MRIIAIVVTEKAASVRIRNHRDWRRLRRATAITTRGPKWSQSKALNRVAMIWRVSGRCLLKASDQTMFNEHYAGKSTANTEETFSEKGVTVQKYWCLHLRDNRREKEQKSVEG